MKEEGVQSLISIPLITIDRTIGAINLASRTHRIFAQREIDLLESIGNQIGLALENAKLFEETKKRLNEITILYEIMKISASSLKLDKMLEEIIGSLNSLFKFETLGILLIDQNTNKLVPHPASYKEFSKSDIGKLGLFVGKGIQDGLLRRGEPLLVIMSAEIKGISVPIRVSVLKYVHLYK